MKDVEYKRTNNAIEMGHSINWQNTKWIEKQKQKKTKKKQSHENYWRGVILEVTGTFV